MGCPVRGPQRHPPAGLFDGPALPSPIGGEVADFDAKQYVRPRKSLKVMSRDIQLAFAAADLACVDAGLRERPIDPERLGVIFGAAIIPGELDELVGTYRSCLVDGQFDFGRWGPSAMAELFPLWMLKYLPNMPACHIGIGQDARGPNNSITMGDVSSLSALAEAVRVLERGQADAMIAGGVGAGLHPVIWARGDVRGLSRRIGRSGRGLAALRRRARRRGQRRRGRRRCSSRRGLMPKPAARRSSPACSAAPPHSSRATCTLSAEAATIARRDGAIRRAIVAALHDAGLTPAELGCVVAHGTSTIDDDRLEAQAIRSVLGDVPVTAPKSNFGYLGAASGALETAVGVFAFQHKLVPPTLNYEHPDPQCPINVVHGRPRPLDRPTALVLSHSPYGQAVAVVLAAANDHP